MTQSSQPEAQGEPKHTPGQTYGTQYSCAICDSKGGGWYGPHTEATHWWMGLDETGQAHFLCDDCKEFLYNVVPCFGDTIVKATGAQP